MSVIQVAQGMERKRKHRCFRLCNVRQHALVVAVLVVLPRLVDNHVKGRQLGMWPTGCDWCLVLLTVGSLVHGATTTTLVGDASSVQDGRDQEVAPWAAPSGRGKSSREKEGNLHEGEAALLEAKVVERHLPAYRALQRGVDLHVRGVSCCVLSYGIVYGECITYIVV